MLSDTLVPVHPCRKRAHSFRRMGSSQMRAGTLRGGTCARRPSCRRAARPQREVGNALSPGRVMWSQAGGAVPSACRRFWACQAMVLLSSTFPAEGRACESCPVRTAGAAHLPTAAAYSLHEKLCLPAREQGCSWFWKGPGRTGAVRQRSVAGRWYSTKWGRGVHTGARAPAAASASAVQVLQVRKGLKRPVASRNRLPGP